MCRSGDLTVLLDFLSALRTTKPLISGKHIDGIKVLSDNTSDVCDNDSGSRKRPSLVAEPERADYRFPGRRAALRQSG
ncbi:hypothetical protein J6590_046725 [Homalodisca vitripennis]|nr:hypothetical protein J6590_046725 [Homalodisca vitripennis]